MTSLVDRYVRTALRRVPESQRSDIDRELRGSIADEVDARVEAGAAHDAAVEQTLLELGDPDRLADRYAGRRAYLIGPELFGVWRRLLTMLYTVVLPIVVILAVIAKVIDSASIGEIIGGAVTAAITVGAHLGFWTTLVFAIIERTGLGREELGLTWRPENLPEYRDGKAANSQLIVDLVWVALLLGALVLQQFTFTAEPVLDPANWSFWWPYLIVVLVLEAGYVLWVHRAPVRTHAMTVVNAVLGLLAAVPLVWLLATDRFFNPDLSLGDAERWAANALIVVIVAVTLWDMVDQGLRTARSRKGLGTQVPGTGITC
ncbi:permease prefix domain 1-containing protein [Actinoplanes sp. NPDC051494]|uniref:permease prefix domain 1-containing protein n=1 Tax=Actinoplanes sp. NPDC051494 TaxID=3363907 RepID=UPI0037B3B858